MKHWLVEPGACGFHSWHHLRFWRRGTALAMALHVYSMNTAQDTEGAIRTMKWCGRKSQELTNQHPSCLCPEHYRHSNGGLMKSVKSVLEVFVIKLNVAGYNILKKNFDLSWEALQPVRYKKTSHLSIKGHRNVVWAMAAQFDAAVVQSFRCFRPSTEFILK